MIYDLLVAKSISQKFYKLDTTTKNTTNLWFKTIPVEKNWLNTIRTHGSESQDQEKASLRNKPVSYLDSTAVKLANGLNKPPWKLSLSYQQLSTF